MAKLSDKLIELRKEKGWSQEEFAEKLDVSRQAVSRWENETALPDAQNILRISKLFGVTADYLLNGDYENERELPAVKTATKEAQPLAQKKKRLHPVFAGCLLVVALAVGVVIGAAITKTALARRAPHTHDVSSIVKENEVAPTCKTEGSYDEVVYCTECNEEVLRTHRSTSMLAHALLSSRKENEIAPTCTAKGSYEEVVYCKTCNEAVLRTHRSLEKLDHQFQNRKCVACGEAQPSEGLLYMSNGDGTCTLDVGDCTDENIVIPAYSPSGEKVVQIKAYAFMGCDVKSIQIPETVTVIGAGAFQSCKALESVNLPSGITEIDFHTFDGCASLKEIIIPSGVTIIRDEAFAGCVACMSIVIPASVTEIGRFAFRSFSGGVGTITFETYAAWELYDVSGKFVTDVDFKYQVFQPVQYLTYRFVEYIWKRQ